MPAINFTGLSAPAVNLGVRNWSSEIAAIPGFAAWTTIRAGKTTVTSGTEGGASVDRITAVAPRIGTVGLVKATGALGPKPITVAGMTGADYTNGELNGLMLGRTVARDNVSVVVIAHIDTTAAQQRDLLGLYGNGDALRIYRGAAGLYAWRSGSTDYAKMAAAFTANGFLMVIGERIGDAVKLRCRSQTATSEIASGTLTTASVPAQVTPVFGQDEISDGHSLATPSTSRAWGNNLMETMVFEGPILSNAGRLALIDGYFTAVYQGAA